MPEPQSETIEAIFFSLSVSSQRLQIELVLRNASRLTNDYKKV